MGEDVEAQEFSRADRTRYREKVHRCLDTFARMLSEHVFDTDDPMTGLEVELNLVDELGDPALKNAEALAAIADPDFQTELGQFNVEINVPPAKLREGGLATFEDNLRRSLNDAEAKSAEVGAHMVMIGILPTLADGHMSPSHMSANPRYRLISEQILAARGEDIHIDITGPERLVTTADSILPEAACTSTQFHVQTSPDQFAAYWNASQAISSVLLALGANSPYALGKELWRETRIPLFEQAADTRSEELKAQGVRPRVWFGERWITSVFDLFEENVRYFPALLPITDEEDPVAVFEAGGTPQLSELRLHNGTIYRWNRPVYDIQGGRPHLRVENRVLPAGPTVADLMANAAFYFGLVRSLAESERPLWSQMSFKAAEENFEACAEHGIDTEIYWPGVGQVRATELTLRRLLPLAKQGLDAWGAPTERERPAARHHRAALPDRDERRGVVRPADGRPAERGAVRRPAAHAPGVPRADALQRAGAHLGLTTSRRSALAQPQPGAAGTRPRVPPAVAGHHDVRQVTVRLPVHRRHRPHPGEVEVLDVERAGPGEPGHQRPLPVVGPGPLQHRLQEVAAQRVVEVAGGVLDHAADLGTTGCAQVQDRGEAVPPLRALVLQHEPAQQDQVGPGERLAGRWHAATMPQVRRHPRRASTGSRPIDPSRRHALRCRSGTSVRRDARECQWGPSSWDTCPSPRVTPRSTERSKRPSSAATSWSSSTPTVAAASTTRRTPPRTTRP